MAKISRATATEVATRMVNDVFKNREANIRGQIKVICEKIAKDKIPQEVLDFCEKWKEYLTLHASLSIACINEEGKIRCWVSSPISFLVSYKVSTLTVEGEDSDALYALNEKRCQLIKEKNALLNNIINTLLDLGTTKRVEVEFSDAAPYFKSAKGGVEKTDKSCRCENLQQMIKAEMDKENECI